MRRAMLMSVPSPFSKFGTSTIVDHVEFQRRSAWRVLIYDSEVDQVRSIAVRAQSPVVVPMLRECL
jgi:hypothetical protein